MAVRMGLTDKVFQMGPQDILTALFTGASGIVTTVDGWVKPLTHTNELS